MYQSLWGMELRSPDRPERSMDENFAMVAEAGFETLLVERENVPRFHVGESLMPETYDTSVNMPPPSLRYRVS